MSEVVRLVHEYAAPPERIWAAWTNVEILQKWFGCGPGMLWNVHEWDVRPGGRIFVSLQFDEEPYEVEGEFAVVEPPNHLRYRWAGDQSVDVRIEAVGTGTRVTLEHTVPDEQKPVVTAGWAAGLEQLAGAV